MDTPASTDSLTFVGTATTIVRLGSFTLLTDPNFLHRGQHAYLGYGLVSKRLREPALSVEQLPPVDVIVHRGRCRMEPFSPAKRGSECSRL